jgi:hypothetical protein
MIFKLRLSRQKHTRTYSTVQCRSKGRSFRGRKGSEWYGALTFLGLISTLLRKRTAEGCPASPRVRDTSGG